MRMAREAVSPECTIRPMKAVAVDHRVAVAHALLTAEIDEDALREGTARIGNHMTARISERGLLDRVEQRVHMFQAALEPLRAPLPDLQLLVLFLEAIEFVEQIQIVDELLLAAPRVDRRLRCGMQNGRNQVR